MTRLRYEDAGAGTALQSVIQGALRQNPCIDLDIDVIAVEAAAGASTQQDWQTLGTIPAGLTVETDGAVHVARGTPTSLFSQTADHSVFQQFNDSGGSPGPAIMWIDFFPDPAIVGTGPIQVSSVDLYLGKNFSAVFFTGTYNIYVTQFDDRWNRVNLCDPIAVAAKTVTSFPYTVDFNALGTKIVFYPGQMLTESGQGLDGSGNPRNVRVDVIAGDPVSRLQTLRGFSIGIETTGKNAWTAPFLGCCSSGVAAQFDTTKFWRVAGNRNCGPYDPYIVGLPPTDTGHFPGDGQGSTGAVPIIGQVYGGAIAVAKGYWGRAKQIIQGPPGPPAEGGRGQNPGQGWHQPYHNLKVQSYAGWTGAQRTGVWAFDLGLVPTQEVEVRIDDARPAGTSIAYTLKGSATGTSGPWTSIGTVTDGEELPASAFYRYYQLTAVFTPSPANLATPELYAWFVTSRKIYNTFSYVDPSVDSSVTVDPLQGQAEIAELVLPLNRIGPRDYNDPATTINTGYAPTNIEAYVYAKNRISGQRYFLNSFRLENREPSEGLERMTFLSGLDQLSGEIPNLVEGYTFPLSGTTVVTAVTSLGSNSYRLQVGTSPWTALNPDGLAGYFYYGITGANAGLIFAITHNTGNTVTVSAIDANGNGQPTPAINDTFQIHSQSFTRPDVVYSGQDYAAIYADIVKNQAALPTRFQGQMPGTSGRTGSGVITNDAQSVSAGGSVNQSYTTALQYAQQLAIHCGGFVSWRRGRVDFVNFYGPVTVVQVWDDRLIADLTPTVGADRRTPSVYVKFNYDLVQQSFQNGAVYNDIDAVQGWGRSNLFDIYQMPDDVCKWNDAGGLEAQYLANLFLSAWSTGTRYWQVKTVLQYPWLQEGDAVAIVTDLYTDRRMNFSADGLTDTGVPLKGRVRAVGIIIGKNLWGDSFVVAIRGLSGITAITGTNTNTGGNYTAITCPDIRATVEPENVNGIVSLQAAVTWTEPTDALYDHMEVIVQATGNTAASHILGAVPPGRVLVHANTIYTFTPVVVTVAGVRTVGNAIGVNTGANPIVTVPIVHGKPGEIHGIIGPFTVVTGGTSGSNSTTSTGTNPNTATTGTPLSGWVDAAAQAAITLSVNPIASDGNYTLTYSLSGTRTNSSLTGNGRAKIEYNISGGGWLLYGYTTPQAIPFSVSGATIVAALAGLVGSASTVAFRVTAEVQNTTPVGLGGQTVSSQVTFSRIDWTYASSGSQTRVGIQLIQPSSLQPHMSPVPQPNPPAAGDAAAGEMTMAQLGSGQVALQVHDGNGIATFKRTDLDYLTGDVTINQGVGSPITMGTGIPVYAGETWVFEVNVRAHGNATGPTGIFVYISITGGGALGTTDWTDFSNSSGPTVFLSSGGTSSTPVACLSYGVDGVVRQTWYCTITTSGTVHLTSYSSNASNPGAIRAGSTLRGTRLA